MNLPPYGAPPQEIEMRDDYSHMKDWSGSDDEWRGFFDTMVTDIQTHIWPVWDGDTASWVGDSAAFASDATRAENALCIKHIQQAGVLDQLPDTPHYHGEYAPKTHYWHYRAEDFIGAFATGENEERDAQAFPGNNLFFYDDQIKPKNVGKLFGRMFESKYDGCFNTKLWFRRPRPQQTAFMFGQSDFVWRQARANVHTGNHPALISGHCAQGLLLMCTLMDDLLTAGTSEGDIPIGAYAQFAVDFGDRRVFAGVHYPTDNLASWVMVLRLIPWVFTDNAPFLRGFIRDALMKNSTVYKLMDQEFGGVDALSVPLQFLRDNVTDLVV